ncbi:hypothetical protein OB919_07675 [Halobacteria archaeon AArc-curdl1]|uniref:Uncharacterized protein n=1 Tax=Natronosalvus hydrolyticus TaxID=2979988 RepID=A0AAP2Z890_9EURY|nr:hypothetical protein [Halobacteria archaeon AArc-curdl1]
MGNDTDTTDDLFPEIEPDPDAVLEAFGIETPEDIITQAETDATVEPDHTPTTDTELDGDDTLASDLFADLADAARALESETVEPVEATPATDEETPDWTELDVSFAVDETSPSEPQAADTGGVQLFFADLETRTDSYPSFELRGSGPTSVRLPNDVFGTEGTN